MLLLLLTTQAIAGPVLAPAKRPRADAPCPVSDLSGDVVVCARNNDAYRLKPLPSRPDQSTIPQAAVRIGDVKLAAEVEQGSDGHFGVINRAMLRLKVPLGGKKKPLTP